MVLGTASHARLRARDRCPPSTLIGGKGGARVQVGFTVGLIEGRDQMSKVAGHIPARISDVPSWDAEIIFL
jgi:hypothetical protein